MNRFKLPIKIKKLRDNAILPDYKHINDAGADVYVSNIQRYNKGERRIEDVSNSHYALKPFETVLCQVGFSVEIPSEFHIEVRPTSGNSLKTPLRVANAPGTIDSNFRGEVGVIVQNNSLDPCLQSMMFITKKWRICK